ncbi:MAG: DsbA family protein [Acetobacteraceae bacterium]
MSRPRLARVAAAALLAAPSAASAQAPAGFTPDQRAAIVEVLREALRSDPSILREAIAALQADNARREAEASRSVVRAQAEALFRDPADPSLGPPRARTTLVEFTDYRCPYCRAMRPVLAELLRSDGDLRLVVKPLPVLGPASVTAARAALAAQLQGRFAPFHEALMALRGGMEEEAILQLATETGLDAARLRRDMASAEVTRRLSASLRLAETLGIQGTPAFVVGDTLLPGAVPIERLREAVAAARAAASR